MSFSANNKRTKFARKKKCGRKVIVYKTRDVSSFFLSFVVGLFSFERESFLLRKGSFRTFLPQKVIVPDFFSVSHFGNARRISQPRLNGH